MTRLVWRWRAWIFALAIGLCLVGFGLYLVGLIFKRGACIRLGWAGGIAGFLLETGAILARWQATGHSPVMGGYENALAGAWFVLGLPLLLRRWFRGVETLGVISLPGAVLMLGYGVMTKPALGPLAPPWQSNWLVVHVIFAWLAYSAFLLVAGLGVLFLAKRRAERRGGEGVFLGRLPRLEILDELSLRLAIFGLVSQTVMIASGAIWAYGLWGRYWGWDPVETWALITWLVYGINLHLRLTMSWKGVWAAWLNMASFATVLVTFYGLGIISTIHTEIL